MKVAADLLKEHPFFSDLNPAYFQLFAGCARLGRANAGETLVRTGEPADQFFIIRHGKMAFEIVSPGNRIIVQTLADGELVGWSWLFPPYIWTYDVKVLEDTSLIAFNGKCIRDKCERDPAMGYDLMKRLSHVLAKRLHTTLLQLLDVYHPGPSAQARR